MPKPLGFFEDTTIDAASPLPGLATARTGPDGKASRQILSCLIQAETQALRWRDDGTAPTAAIGMLLPVNTVLEYDGDFDDFQCISVVAGAKINVAYYGV